MEDYLYIFLDEGGNLDFSSTGTKYFIVTSLTKERPFCAYKELCDLKYDLAEQGTCLQSFHATADKQHVRDKVFNIIARSLDGVRVDSVIVKKSKTEPAIQPPVIFYPRMIGYLLRHVLDRLDMSNMRKFWFLPTRCRWSV